PDVKALALQLRAQVAVMQAQLPQARALGDRVAPLRQWAIAGPFENEGRNGLSREFEPGRTGYDPRAPDQGRGPEGRWRTPPELAPYGFVDLSSAVSPRQNVTVYAATSVRSDRERAVILHLGASGASKLWVNGALVSEDANEHPSRFDQRAVAALLLPG